MARFARDRSLVEALADGVDALLRAEGSSYNSHDLLTWLNTNRPTPLHDLYDLYRDCIDPETTADQQIGKFLSRLGQIKIGEQVSDRLIDQRGSGDRNGACPSSVWEVSERTRAGLTAARELLFGPGGFFDRVAAEPLPVPTTGTAADWIERISGTFKDDPVFAEMVRLGREYRETGRPSDDEP